MKSIQFDNAMYYNLIIDLLSIESDMDTNEKLVDYYQTNLIPRGY